MAGDGEGDATDKAVHVVMFPWLAINHIRPFAELARKMVSAGEGGVRVTFLTAAGNVPRVQALLASAAGAVAVVPLHLPHVKGLPPGASSTAELSADGAELLKLAVDGTRPQVSMLLAELRPAVVLIDFATPWVCDVAAPLGVKALNFRVFNAVPTAYVAVPARVVHGQRPSAHDLTMAPPGFPPASPVSTIPTYQGEALTYVFSSFYDMPSVYERVVATFRGSAGIVMNTCSEMEGPYIDYTASQYGKPVLFAGPVVPEPPQGALEEPWASWLSSFPDNAVVFASFGSDTFLPVAAATELLLGLEATNRPFVAVFNFPHGADTAAELRARVPPGLEERVKGRGLVHTGQVQQQHILQHRRVGCYVNDAGLSALVEGIVAGCRQVMLPMKVDQYFNAALFARELAVGVEVARRDKDGWFGREDVRDAIAAAAAAGGEGNTRKWREFLTDDVVQKRFADQFVRELKLLLKA